MNTYDILKQPDATYELVYVDNGRFKRYPVIIRFADDKEIYVVTEYSLNFVKPKGRTQAEFLVRSKNGLWGAKVVINECTTSYKDITFVFKAPKDWVNKDQRLNARKIYDIPPVKIKFNDGYELSAKFVNISNGGCRCVYNDSMDSKYKNIPADIEFETEDKELMVLPAKFLRESLDNVSLHFFGAFKFVNLPPVTKINLRTFIASLH